MRSFDPDDVDALLAQELSGFDPNSRASGSGIIGGLVTNWHELSDAEAAQRWEALRAWVEWFTVRYNVPISVVPDCWWRHGAIVEELSALHTAHHAAFDLSDSGFGPIGWHERLAIAIPRLNRAYGGGCNNGHKPTRPRSWAHATDEQEWEAWTTTAHAQ